MIKLVYKPVSLLVSLLAGLLAGAIFKQVWKVAAREEDAPKATDEERGWREVLIAAAIEGPHTDMKVGNNHEAHKPLSKSSSRS